MSDIQTLETELNILNKIDVPIGESSGPEPLGWKDRAVSLPLVQHWSGSSPQEEAHTYIGYNDSGLRCYVWMKEDSPFNLGSRNNEKLFLMGSVIEFFVQPTEGSFYWEIHLSPNSHHMDLLLPEPGLIKGAANIWDQLIAPDSGTSYQIQCQNDNWTADVCIPWEAFKLQQPPVGKSWKIAVCRYNYQKPDMPEWDAQTGLPKLGTPEYSSTALLSRLDYHRVEEYHNLTFR